MQRRTDLAINVFEEFDWDVVKFIVNRSNHAFDGFLYGLNAGFKRARAFLGVGIEDGEAHKGVNGSHLHEFQVLEPWFLFLGSLSTDSTSRMNSIFLKSN